MSMLLKERDLYDEIWQLSSYAEHSPGAQRVGPFLEMAALEDGHGSTVLDAGCGSGKGALALQAHGFAVTLCDLTHTGLVPEARGLPFTYACLWHDLRAQLPYVFGGAFDYVYCCDVLEHIPERFTMLVVDQLLRVARRGVFLSVSLVPDTFGAMVGQPLHRTVQPFTWWRDSLAELGRVAEARDLIDSALFLVRR